MASLGKDIAFLRMKQKLSIKDVYEQSHIPLSTLQSIENDTIFEKSEKSTVYIRNFVRSYARAVHINEQEIIHALNLQQRKMYRGELLTERQRLSMKETQYSANVSAESPIVSKACHWIPKPLETTSIDKSIQVCPVDDWKAIGTGKEQKFISGFNFEKAELFTLFTLILLLVTLLVYYFLYG